MESLVVLTIRWLDFGAGFAAERLGESGAGFWAGSPVAPADTGRAFSFDGSDGSADPAFFAVAFERDLLGLAGVELTACSTFCCSDRQTGMWEAALLDRSFFDSGCFE